MQKWNRSDRQYVCLYSSIRRNRCKVCTKVLFNAGSLQQFQQLFGGHASGLTQFSKNDLHVLVGHLVRGTNVGNNLFKAFECDVFGFLVLGGSDDVFLESSWNALSIAAVEWFGKRK